ncbi:MAG TPA: IS607 family transposase [Oscillatoriaceae cyanobacterium M33_DOE_052]|uniref:IS607 family transposase n=1 Tax=Planktothricoides sp. SpSt-374 TaxID=2282167 RepID=A0A7C3VHU1_9CYAN|nr:IS607 family transposase [Oscillatoriaceae cyanobacterium M33_DOE_052]
MKYVTPQKAASLLGVSVSSLRRWSDSGQLTTFRTPGGQRRYNLEEIEKAAKLPRPVVTVCYARVSTHSQRDELQRQIEFLRSREPEAELVSEIGSGLNFRRRKFLAVLDRVLAGDIQRLVVAYPDRLVRFGFELIKWLCAKTECELVVLHERQLSPEQELVTDMLSIIHCFSSRLDGLRKYQKPIKEALQEDYQTRSQQKPDQEAAKQCDENQGLPHS